MKKHILNVENDFKNFEEKIFKGELTVNLK